jgi:hypothetical protein
MNIQQIRMIAQAERLMDAGEIPWVWSVGPYGQKERLSVAPDVMETLGLEQGQSVNSIIVNAIAELSIQILKDRIDETIQKIEDEQLTDDFDFRKEMDK